MRDARTGKFSQERIRQRVANRRCRRKCHAVPGKVCRRYDCSCCRVCRCTPICKLGIHRVQTAPFRIPRIQFIPGFNYRRTVAQFSSLFRRSEMDATMNQVVHKVFCQGLFFFALDGGRRAGHTRNICANRYAAVLCSGDNVNRSPSCFRLKNHSVST